MLFYIYPPAPACQGPLGCEIQLLALKLLSYVPPSYSPPRAPKTNCKPRGRGGFGCLGAPFWEPKNGARKTTKK